LSLEVLFWSSTPPYYSRVGCLILQISISGYQRSPLNIPESWWQYTSSDAVCQIRR
jgi:hypothetical protein